MTKTLYLVTIIIGLLYASRSQVLDEDPLANERPFLPDLIIESGTTDSINDFFISSETNVETLGEEIEEFFESEANELVAIVESIINEFAEFEFGDGVNTPLIPAEIENDIAQSVAQVDSSLERPVNVVMDNANNVASNLGSDVSLVASGVDVQASDGFAKSVNEAIDSTGVDLNAAVSDPSGTANTVLNQASNNLDQIGETVNSAASNAGNTLTIDANPQAADAIFDASNNIRDAVTSASADINTVADNIQSSSTYGQIAPTIDSIANAAADSVSLTSSTESGSTVIDAANNVGNAVSSAVQPN